MIENRAVVHRASAIPEFAETQIQAESWSPEQLLGWAFRVFGHEFAIASAFGAEGIALIDIAAQLRKPRVFTLDTGFLFPETFALINIIEKRYGINVEIVASDCTPDEQDRLHGRRLWSRNPHLCCNIRKLDPLRRKLADLRAWVTAIRRDQTPARAAAGKLEWDNRFNCVKINPLADWTNDMVWNYIRSRRLPYNPLHDRNYPSIGCIHCTRAVLPGEHPRAGRWSGFGKTECGLHERLVVIQNRP